MIGVGTADYELKSFWRGVKIAMKSFKIELLKIKDSLFSR